MEPKIAREYYLISINPKNGYYFNFGNEFGYGILGGILMDLYREKRIAFQDKRLVVVNPSPTNYPMFDKVIEIITKKGSIKVASLIGRMAFKGMFYRREMIELMLSNNDIIRVRKKFLGISYNRYFPTDRDFRMSLIRRVRDILLRNETPAPEELLLLALIHACQLYRALSDVREERRRMRMNMKILLKSGNNYSHDFDDIKELSSGIRKAIAAAQASHTAAI